MENEVKFSVVIPTRNRGESLRNLLSRIIDQSVSPTEIIIVDSSEEKQLVYEKFDQRIKYIHTTQMSAAKQRNTGMLSLKEDIQVLFFLDDDTNPNSKYFEEMIKTLTAYNAVGVSGLAINTEKKERIPPKGLVGLMKRITFLDSNIDGKLLISGVGIPVRKKNIGVIEVEWLIGCSCWDFRKIEKLRFEEDFMGYSLGEDVIFSARARRLGKLFVNSGIFLDHRELPQVDQNIITFNYMWVYYRFRISNFLENKFAFYPAFYLSVLAKIILALVTMLTRPLRGIKQIVGLTLGLINIFKGIFKK
jgi:glycosyltransferase involved in cell wall biosynthesis